MHSTLGLRGGYGPGAYVAVTTAVVAWIESGRQPTEHIFGALVALEQLFNHAICQRGDERYESTQFGQRMSGVRVANDVLVALEQLDPRSKDWLPELRTIVMAHKTTVSELMEDNDVVFQDERLDRLKQYLDELLRQGRTEKSARIVLE